MTAGTVTQKLRPLRLAFLVNPANREDVLKAIEVSSTFWGGLFNPLVPCFKARVPSNWNREKLLRPKSPREIVDGYLDAFDPDLIVPISVGLDGRFSVGNRTLVPPDELFGDILKSGTAGYGVGAIELSHHLAEKEFKFTRKFPLEFILPKIDGPHRTFLSSVFGAWPDDIAQLIKMHLGKSMEIAEPVCTIRNFETLLEGRYLFPRRVGLQSIEYRPRAPCIYCLDATNSLDIIDYWNLRAAGYYVVPAPKQSFSSQPLMEWIRTFVDSNHSEDSNTFRHTTVQVGRSLDEAEVRRFMLSVGLDASHTANNPKYVTRTWYPRLWDKWARENTDERISVFYAKDSETAFDGTDGRMSLKTLVPEFKNWGTSKKHILCVNEISYSVYGSATTMAEILPESSMAISQSVLFSGINSARLSRTGPAYSIRPHAHRITFQIPEAEPFMLSWFRSSGWKVELSSAGLIAKQMLKRLKGVDGIHSIHSERLIGLLDKRASEKLEHTQPGSPRSSKWIGESALAKEVKTILKEEQLHFDSSTYVRRLVESNILGLGLELHCPSCLRWMWKSVDGLSANIECEQCLSTFPISHAPKNERVWSYKPTGPFNVRNFAGGAYPVLFSLRFFGGFNKKRTTPLLSLNAKKGAIDCEIDLALFCEDGQWHAPRHELLLVECKAYDEFKKADVERMEALGKEFPGSIIVFSKLGRSLNTREANLIASLTIRQRKLWAAQKPHVTTMVLTGTELFSRWGPAECWKDATGPNSGVYSKWSHAHSLGEIAEATQQIYLGIPPLHAWAEIFFKGKKRRKKNSTNPK